MKTIFMDIDGVICKEGKRNQEVFDLIQEKKANFVFCTGRGFPRCVEILEEVLTKDSLLIIENGSKIVSETGKIIYEKKLSDQTKKAFEKIPTSQIDYMIYYENQKKGYVSFSKVPLRYVQTNYQEYTKFYQELLQSELTQITIKWQKEMEKEKFRYFLESKKINVHKSEDCLLIHEKKVSKKSGILKYLEQKNISLEDVIVIGNDYNDLEMFEISCPMKIAVKDQYTPKKLLEMATVITDYDHLAEEIKKFENI